MALANDYAKEICLPFRPWYDIQLSSKYNHISIWKLKRKSCDKYRYFQKPSAKVESIRIGWDNDTAVLSYFCNILTFYSHHTSFKVVVISLFTVWYFSFLSPAVYLWQMAHSDSLLLEWKSLWCVWREKYI